MSLVHYMKYGMTPCQKPMPPKDWPEGEKWSENWEDVNCPECVKGKPPYPDTFRIAADGKSITCLHCDRTSFHPKDVEHRYCGHCHVLHDDIWPPARQWWIENKSETGLRTTEFRLAKHSVKGTDIVEIWQTGILVGVIYPGQDSINVISKFLKPEVDVVTDTPKQIRLFFRIHDRN